jgi:hypothetical protein
MEEGAMQIPLSKGLSAYISASDYPLISRYTWHANYSNKGKKPVYYARGFVGKQRILLHRFIMSAPADLKVDHIDRNPLNCTRSNLRLMTHSQNLHNQAARTETGYKGVQRFENGKYYACARYKGKTLYLGKFSTAELAAEAYDRHAIAVYGEFATTNFLSL